jgi:excisionase family DNA binding protein
MAEDPYIILGEALAAVLRRELRDAVHDVVLGAVQEALAEVLPGADPTMIDVAEAARRLGLGTTKTKQLIAAGELPSVLIGRRRKVPVEAIEGYIRRLTDPEQLRLPGISAQ